MWLANLRSEASRCVRRVVLLILKESYQKRTCAAVAHFHAHWMLKILVYSGAGSFPFAGSRMLDSFGMFQQFGVR